MKYYTFHLDNENMAYHLDITDEVKNPEDYSITTYDAKFRKNRILFIDDATCRNINDAEFYERTNLNPNPKILFHIIQDKSAVRFLKSLAGSFQTPMSKIIMMMVVGSAVVIGLAMLMG